MKMTPGSTLKKEMTIVGSALETKTTKKSINASQLKN